MTENLAHNIAESAVQLFSLFFLRQLNDRIGIREYLQSPGC